MKNLFPFLFLFLAACSPSAEKKQPTPEKETNAGAETTVENADTTALADGDILLKMGKGEISRQIALILKEKIRLSHAAVFYREKNTGMLVHSIAGQFAGKDGVQKITLREFLEDVEPGSLFVLRPKAEPEKKELMIAAVKRWERKNLGFDYTLRLNDTSQMYCSEVIYHATYAARGKYPKIKTVYNDGKEVITFNSLLEDSSSYTLVFPPVVK